MRTAFIALILSAAGTVIVTDNAVAQRWCAISNQGAANCGFPTIDQCRSEVSGNGGSCMPEAPVGHRQPGRRQRPPTSERQSRFAAGSGEQESRQADLVPWLLRRSSKIQLRASLAKPGGIDRQCPCHRIRLLAGVTADAFGV
jgi:hypothetical protein